ncbi:MAG: tetratricopeptide repeat protein [Gammaproteobacteria bacterium]
MTQLKMLLPVVSALMLTACAGGLAPVRDRSVGDVPTGTGIPLPDETPLIIEPVAEPRSPPPVSTMASAPAVLALLDTSRTQLQANDRAGAVRSIERALRLEPKNPQLWHQLAQIRLQEENWRQAIALAQKSHSLSGERADLQKANTELIERARAGIANNL